MELVYLYIPKYKSIKDQEYNFSNRYRFARAISEKGKKVTIDLVEENDTSDKWQTNFFGKRISNLTVIVGANGTGKSSMLQFINEELSVSGNSKGYNFIGIFEEGGKFYIKKRNELVTIEEKFDVEDTVDGISMIQYYPLSDLTFSNEYLFNQVGGNRVNVSDNALFADDFEREKSANRNEIFKTEFQPALSPYVISNVERELEFFLIDTIGEIEPAHVLSIEFLDIEFHLRSQIQSYEESVRKWEKNESLRQSFEGTLRNLRSLLQLFKGAGSLVFTEEHKITRALSFMLFIDIQFALDQAIGEQSDSHLEKMQDDLVKNIAEILYALKETQKERPLELEDYHGALKRIDATEMDHLNIAMNARRIHDFLTTHLKWTLANQPENLASRDLFDLDRLGTNSAVGKVNLFFREFPDETRAFLKQLKGISLITRILSYEWKSRLNQTYHYSTGESQMIKLFSRLNYGFNRLMDPIKNSRVLVMLDEAELAMHPEWQRKFIRWLTKFIDERIETGLVQLILTTHSPLMLSDIPSQNVIRLSKDGIVNNGTNSFGANLFDLMKDSFFLKSGFIGEFAQKKINSVIEFIQSKDTANNKEWTIDSARSFINIIGEPLIREELRRLFLEQFYEDLTDEDLDEEIEWIKRLKEKRSDSD